MRLMKRLGCVLLWSLWALAFVAPLRAQFSDDNVIKMPPGRAAWRHEDSGLLLPHQLGALSLEVGFRYKEAALGVQIRYLERTLGIKADVYVYPCPGKTDSEDVTRKTLVTEMGNVLGEIQMVVKQGDYRNAEFGKGVTYTIPVGERQMPVVEAPIQFERVDREHPEVEPIQLNSFAVLTFYNGQFVKLRCTYARSAEDKVKPVRETFVKEWLRCVTDSAKGQQVRDWIRDYRQDPLSPEALGAAAQVVDFAVKTPLVEFAVGSSVSKLAEKIGGQDTKKLLMGAMIVGATDAALKAQPMDKVVQSAVGAVRKWCEAWKKLHPDFEIPSLSDFAEGVKKENQVGPTAEDKSSI